MKDQKGLTLIEPLLAVTAIALGVVLISNLPNSVSIINRSRHTSIAKDIANSKLEELRTQGYANLSITDEPLTFLTADLNHLPHGTASYEINPCPETICTNDEHVRKVKIRVNWTEPNENKSIEITTLISEGGLGR